MAALTRRGWDTILVEVIKRAGGINYSGFPARAQQLISAAYYDICSLYRHSELEATSGSLLSAGDYFFLMTGFEPDLYHLHALYESVNDGGSTPSRILQRRDLAGWAMHYNTTAGQPESYAVHGNTGSIMAVFDREADEERTYAVLYQFLPTRPDFTTDDTPATGPQWDEHLIELALSKIGAAVGDQQLAAVNAALFRDFVSQNAQNLIEQSQGASSTPQGVVSHRMSTGKVP